MELKISKNRKRVIVSTLGTIAGLAMLFQNCAPATIATDGYSTSLSQDPGNSLYRLPASFNEILNTGVTCAATVSATAVPVGGSATVTITTTGALAAGYRVYAYGSKNGVADANEITPDFTTTLSTTYANPGTIGGNYIRYFQIRDAAGRALCQTNQLAVNFEGPSCTLSVSATTIKVGFGAAFTTAYSQGAVVPTGGRLEFHGLNNGLEIAPIPYDSTNFTYYVRAMTSLDAGSTYIRRIVVRRADNSVYCQTNNVRLNVIN